MNNVIALLTDKDDQKAFENMKTIVDECQRNDCYYENINDFLYLLNDKKSYTRVRAFIILTALSKWDNDGKFKEYLPEMFRLLHDEKPTVVRQCLNELKVLVNKRNDFCDDVLTELETIDIGQYKDSMSPLITKDIMAVKEEIEKIRSQKIKDNEYQIVRLSERRDLKERAARWFSEKWRISEQAYIDSIEESFDSVVPSWYVMLDGERIIAGMGVIENDFHDRPDLKPNVCAVYTEADYRRQGLAGRLLDYVCKDMADRGIDTLYLVTMHDGFYERYNWQFYCMVQGDGDKEMSRMYVHHQK